MPAPQRLDRYGRPLPDLTPAEAQTRLGHPRNESYRTYLYALIDDVCRIVCRRGWSGEVRVGFRVEDGFIVRDMRVGTERHRQPPPSEEPTS